LTHFLLPSPGKAERKRLIPPLEEGDDRASGKFYQIEAADED